ncbi:MAG: cohesin domain-containing protein [Acutalibacteraceae bacterium]|nr:cohesin domain-containing protein [Acutalibacteraceae bacterium]
MKRISKICISALLLISMFVFTLPVIGSADEKMTVNGKEVKKGDTVLYEYFVEVKAEGTIAGAGCYLDYDKDCLEYIDGSIGFDIFNNAMYNITDGKIYYSAVNAYGYDFTGEKLIISAAFKVKDTSKGAVEIKHTFDEFFTLENENEDLTKKDYVEREVVTVNDYEKNTAPYLGTDADEMQEYIGDESFKLDDLFTGIPNTNATSSGSVPRTTSNPGTAVDNVDNNNNNNDNAPDNPDNGSQKSNTNNSNSNNENNRSSDKDGNMVVFVGVIAAFILVAVGAVVFLVKGKKKK